MNEGMELRERIAKIASNTEALANSYAADHHGPSVIAANFRRIARSLREALAGQPFVAGHGWTPPARTFGGPERCEVLLARHPCPYSRADHDPDLPPEDVDFTGRRRTITRDPQVPHLHLQPVPGCFRCDLRKDEMR